jgi:uncharacterized protein (DUF433 family)
MSNEAADILTEYAHVVQTPGILGGEPRLKGHRIRVRDVAAARDLGGHGAEEIAGSVFPSLTLAEVYAALAYFEDHKAELNALAAHEADRVAQFELQQAALSQDRRPRVPIVDAGE